MYLLLIISHLLFFLLQIVTYIIKITNSHFVFVYFPSLCPWLGFDWIVKGTPYDVMMMQSCQLTCDSNFEVNVQILKVATTT